MGRYTRADLLPPARLVWLVELTLRGRVYRFASEPVAVDSDAGPLLFLEGLSPIKFAEESGPEDLGVGERDVGIQVLFGVGADPGALGWAALAEGGHDLGDARGEVSLIRQGDPFERREVVLAGRLIRPEYGARAEPVRFSVVEEPTEDRGQVPTDREVVGVDTWPGSGVLVASDSAKGQQYPLVIGQPGTILGSDTADLFPGVPGLLVRISQTGDNSSTDAELVIARGHIAACTAGAAAVRVYNVSKYDPGSLVKYDQTYPCTAGVDAFGQQVTKVTVPGTGITGLLVEDGDEIHASIIAGGGAIYDGRPARDAVDVIRYLLGLSTLRLPALVPHVEERLRGYKFDFFTNESASPWEILRQDVLPWLPVSLMFGDGGAELVFWDFDATEADAIDVINPSTRGGQRAGPVKFSDASKLYNQLRIRFARRSDSGAYLRELTMGPLRSEASDRYIVDPYAVESYSRHQGPRGEPLVGTPLEASTIDDPATAAAVLRWRLRLHGSTRRRLSYLLPQEYQYLRPGDVVLVTDGEVALDRALCHVRRVERGPGDVQIELATVPNFIRTAPGA